MRLQLLPWSSQSVIMNPTLNRRLERRFHETSVSLLGDPLNIRGSAVSANAYFSGEIPPRRCASFECGRLHVQSMDDSSDWLDGVFEVGLGRGARSWPSKANLLGSSTATENRSLRFEQRALEYVTRAIARRLGTNMKTCRNRYASGSVPRAAASSRLGSLPRCCLSISLAQPRKLRCWATVAGTLC